MDMHRHKMSTERNYCFRGPAVGARTENRAAHGNVTVVERCACGATRETNINGRHVERGAWMQPEWSIEARSLRGDFDAFERDLISRG
jgi:hypothetical protein